MSGGNSPTWLVATILDSVIIDHFYHHNKFNWTVLKEPVSLGPRFHLYSYIEREREIELYLILKWSHPPLDATRHFSHKTPLLWFYNLHSLDYKVASHLAWPQGQIVLLRGNEYPGPWALTVLATKIMVILFLYTSLLLWLICVSPWFNEVLANKLNTYCVPDVVDRAVTKSI